MQFDGFISSNNFPTPLSMEPAKKKFLLSNDPTPRVQDSEIESLSEIKYTPGESFATYDKKLFALESADFLIRDLEMGFCPTPSEQISRFTSCLKAALKNLGDQESDEAYDFSNIEQFQRYVDLISDLKRDVHNNTKLKNLTKQTIADLKALKPGQSLWLPGGFKTDKMTQEMIYVIEKQKNGKFAFTVVNTGEGIENHPGFVFHGKAKFQTHLTKENILEVDICQNEFIESLLEMQLSFDWYYKTTHADNIYKGLFPYLKGSEPRKIDPRNFPEFYQGKQKSETTSLMKALFTSLRQDCIRKGTSFEEGLKTYKRIKFFYTANSLRDACYDFSTSHFCKSQAIFIKEIAEKQARSARKLFKEGVLTKQTLQRTEATLIHIKEGLKSAKGLAKKSLGKRAEKYDYSYKDSRSASSAFTFKEPVPPYDFVDRPRKASCPSLSVKKILKTSEVNLTSSSDVKDFLLKQYNTFQTILLSNPTQEQVEVVLQALIATVRSLPIPSKADAFWEMPDEEIDDCLEALYKISRIFLSTQTTDGKTLTAEAQVELHALFAISQRLCFKKNDLNINQERVPVESFIEFYQNPQVLLISPTARERIEKIRSYCNDQYDLTAPVDTTVFTENLKKSLFIPKDYGVHDVTQVSDFEKVDNAYSRFLRKALSNPIVIANLKKAGLQNASLEEKMHALLSDRLQDKPRLLPRSYHYFRQIFFASEFSKSITTSPDRIAEEFFYKKTVTKYRDEVYTSFTLKIDAGFVSGYSNPEWTGDRELRKNIQDSFSTRDQNSLMYDFIKEAEREMALISVSGPDEVVRAIAHAENNLPGFFEDEKNRALFACHFFRPGRLNTTFFHDPRVAKKVIHFLHQKIDFFKTKKNLKAALFFVNLAATVAEEVKNCHSKHGPRFTEVGIENLNFLRDYREELLEEILPLADSFVEKSEVYMQLANLHALFSTKDLLAKLKYGGEEANTLAIDLLTSLILPTLSNKYPYPVESKNLLLLMKDSLFDYLNKSNSKRDEILNAIIERFIEKNANWSKLGDAAIYEDPSQGLKIDFQAGCIYENDELLTYLPNKIADNNLFKTIFKGITGVSYNKNSEKRKHSSYSKESPYFVIHEGEKTSKVWVNKNDNGILIEREIEGVTYLSIETSKLLHINETLPCELLEPDDIIWSHVKPQQSTRGFFSKSLGFRDNKEGHFRVEKKNGEVFYLHYEGSSDVFNMTKITKEDLELIEPSKTIAPDFTRFEPLKNTRFYASPKVKNQLARFEFSSLKLGFNVRTVDGVTRAFSEDIPGFFVSSNQNCKPYEFMPYALVLENASGQKKFLIPEKSRVFKALGFEQSFSPIQIHETGTNKYLCYDVEETAKGDRLKAVSAHEGLYAVYLMVLNKKYSKASYYLNQSHSLSRYTENEQELIKNITMTLAKDGHPSAKALLLRLVNMGEINRKKHASNDIQEPKKEEVLALLTSYQNYVANKNNETHCFLTVQEEKNILRTLLAEFKKQLQKLDDFEIPAFIKDILKNQQLKIFPTLQSRLRELAGKENELEEIDLQNQMQSLEPKKEALLSDVYRGDFFSLIAEPTKPLHQFNKPLSLSREDFRVWFSTFYGILKSGSTEDKERLHKLLKLMEGSSLLLKEEGSSQKAFFNLLKALRDSPSSFPPVSELLAYKEFVYDRNKTDYWQKKDDFDKKKEALFQRLVKLTDRGGNSIFNFANLGALFNAVLFSTGNEAEEILHNEIPTLQDFLKLSLTISQEPLPPAIRDLDKGAIDPYFEKLIRKFFKKDFQCSPPPLEFDELEENPLVKARSAEVKKMMEAYYATKPKEEVFYKLRNKTSLDTLQKTLEGTIKSFKKDLKKREERLLKALNTLSNEEGAFRHLALLGKEIPKVTLDGGVNLFLMGKLPKDLDLEMGTYLALKSRVAQGANCLENLEKLKDSKDMNGERELAIHRLAEDLSIQRGYLGEGSTKLQRLYLAFEGKNGLLLRAKQVAILNDFANYSDEKALQLIAMLGTGSGKSKILAQLMQLIRRGVSPLIVNLWPSPLYMVNANDTKGQVGPSFGQVSDSFEYGRNSPLTLDHIRFTLRELRQAALETRQVNARPENIQSAELKFLEALELIDKNELQEEEIIHCFQELLKTFRASETHIDEGHVNLSPRHEVNFTLGDPKPVSEKHVEAIEMIYKTLLREFKGVVNLTNFQSLLEKETFDHAQKEKLAISLMPYMVITEEQKDSYIKYVTEKESAMPPWLAAHPKKEEIAVLRGELTLLLVETLSKSTAVHYGLSKLNSDIEYAKPYDANDSCVELSEYDNAHETLNKTYQTYLNRRLCLDQVWRTIDSWQKAGVDEAKQKRKDPKDTEAYRDFEKYFPKGMPGLFVLTKSDVDKWLSKINKNDDFIFYYIKKHVAPSIQQYPEKLKSDPQNLKSCFKNIIAMSATPGPKEIYGADAEFRTDKGSDELVLDTLSQKCKDNKSIHELNANQPGQILDEIIKDLLPKETLIRMLIDIGSLFKGISNEQLASKLLEHFKSTNPEIKGVVFFKDDELMSLEINPQGGTKLIPFERSLLKPKERFTYCDNKHMFGADIRQYPQAIGLCTYDRHVDLDDMLQGVGRLRELTKGQSVEWAITKEAKNLITKDELSFVDLRNHSLKNQAERESDDLYRSFRQQMRNEIRLKLMIKLIYAGSFRQVIALYRDFRKFLVEKNPTSAIELYGSPQEEVRTLKALKLERKQLIKQVDEFTSLSAHEKTSLKEALESYKQKALDLKEKFPEKVKISNTILGTESEIQQQVQQEMNVEEDTLVYDRNGLFKRKPDLWGNSFDPFAGTWANPSSMVLYNISRFVKSIFSFLKSLPLALLAPIRFIANKLGAPRGLISGLAKGTIMLTAGLVNLAALLAIGSVVAALSLSLALIASIPLLIGKVTGVLFNKSSSPVPLFEASEVVRSGSFEDASKLSALLRSKSGSILMTNNFLKRQESSVELPNMPPFGKEQRTCHEVVVIEDTDANGHKTYSIIMGDQSTDARFFRQALYLDSLLSQDASKRTRKVCLYDLNLGIVADGKNCFNEDELNKNEAFLELIVKVKIFNGDLNYTHEEEKILDKLLSNDEEKEKAAALIRKALTWKSERKKLFNQSLIHHMVTV
ncbi:DUF3638 domain-containing protein [Criblamydia sequanensis]|uniref:Membrane protein n=1 Tax=Candidatus Criblamydia sequanensis CRIB-18 TaxID=1437425 RepID=A0A090E154_9BACT|nr:DUF3638 domain-containing protein [Criblamydia sequanensis]CDR34504.1 putative membrane protein [Criblamydia sequanensis CRIB-18]